MAGPGGVEVGRASIRVLPDTSQFGKSLGAYIQRIERSIKVDLPVELDKSQFRRDLAQVQAESAKTKVDVPVKPVQLDDFQRRIQATVAKLSRELEAKIPVTPEGEKFRQQAEAQIKGLSALLKVKVPLDVENATAFRRQVLDQLAEVELIAKGTHPTIHMRVDVDRSIFQQMRSLEGTLGLAKKAAEGAAGAVGGITDAGLSAIGTLGKIPPIAYGIAAALTLAAPLAADLAVSLGPSLLVAIPAVLSIGAALGVAALSMGKLKSAFKPITDGFKDMEDAIGSALTRGVRPLVQEFAESALPTIQRGLTGVARVMNGFLKDFLAWAGSAPTVRLIGQVFDGLASSMRPLGGAATAFADAILRIAKDAAPALRLVNDTIRDLAVRFDTFIKSKDKDGSLTRTITDSVVAAGRLIGALVNLGGAIGRLFADIGRGSTKSFSDGINSIADAINRFNDNGGGDKIREFLIGTGKAIGDYFSSGEFQRTVSDFRDFARTTADLLGPLAALVRGVQSLGDGIRSLPGGSSALDGLASALNPLVSAIRTINGLATEVPQTWATIQSATATAWAAITGFVSDAWATITSTVTSATSAVIGAITSAWNGVVGFFSGIWANITSAVSTGWAAVVAAVSAAAGAVAAAFRTVVAVLSAVWSAFWNNSFVQLVVAGFGLAQAVINLAVAVVEAVFRGLVAFITVSVQGIVGAVTRAWNLVYSTTATVWGAVSSFLSTVWATISGVVSRAASAVTGYVTAAWNAVTGVTTRVWAAVSGAVSAAWTAITARSSAAGASVLGTVSSWFSRVWTTIVDAFQRAYTGASQWISNLVTTVTGLGARVLAAVSGFGTILFDAGARLIQGLIDGITSKISAVTNAINGIANKIKGFFPGSPVKEGPLVSWNNGGAGKRLVSMLVTGLSDNSDVESAMRSLAGKVAVPLQASALSGDAAPGGLLGAGTVVNVNVTNPVPETASESTTRIARKLALLGPAALPA